MSFCIIQPINIIDQNKKVFFRLRYYLRNISFPLLYRLLKGWQIVETVGELLDPLREAWTFRCAREGWKEPGLRVSSGYRGFRLNEAVGGSVRSAHCVGYAFDLVPMNGRLAEFKAFCREWLRGWAFDQMISEDENAAGVPRWVHIGWKDCEGRQRRQMLSMRGGKYQPMTA